MTKNSNDKIERYYFEKFRKIYQLPGGTVIYGDKPDVIIHSERKIGIEMTSFFLESGSNLDSEQRQRPLRGPILELGRKLYRAKGRRSDVSLTVSFDENTPITGTRRKALPQELADLLHGIDNRESGAIEWHLFRTKMPEISTIWLHAKEQVDAEWRLLGGRSVGLMRKDSLEAIVKEKEAKSHEYEQCDAHWLLIVVDGMDAAQDQEIRIDDPHIHSDIFEKIIVFDPLFGYVVEAK